MLRRDASLPEEKVRVSLSNTRQGYIYCVDHFLWWATTVSRSVDCNGAVMRAARPTYCTRAETTSIALIQKL